MNSERELLALRKNVLAARSSMLRLKAAVEIESLRESLACREMAGTIMGSSGVRSLLFGSLVLLAGRSGLGRLIRAAMAGIAIAKAVTMVGRLVRRPDPAPSERSP
jgi:hypothetical protein